MPILNIGRFMIEWLCGRLINIEFIDTGKNDFEWLSEASRRIVDDLLLTAGADATDDIEGDTNDGFEPPSPSVVVRAGAMDDTF